MAKKCLSCGSVWTLGLAQCVFCGGESTEVTLPPAPLAEIGSAGEPRVTTTVIEKRGRAADVVSTSGPALALSSRWEIPPTLPLILGLTALVVCGILPPAVRMSGQQTLALLACGLLAPLPPLAWIVGLKYESRCRERGVPPDGTATAGKILGVVATVLLVFEFAVFTILVIVHSAGRGGAVQA